MRLLKNLCIALSLIYLFVKPSLGSEVNIKLNLETDLEKYEYYLLEIGDNPDTLYKNNYRHHEGIIKYSHKTEFPYLAALHLKDSSHMHHSVFIFEVDSSYLELKINTLVDWRKVEYFQVKGSKFQKKFMDWKKEVSEIRLKEKAGDISKETKNELIYESAIKFIETAPTHPFGYFLISNLLDNLSESTIILLKNLIDNNKTDHPQILMFEKDIKKIYPQKKNDFMIVC